jgi:EpsI family protein
MLTRAGILFCCFVGASVLVDRANRPEEVRPRTALDAFPMAVDDWRGTRAPSMDPKTLDILRVDDYLTRFYVTPSRMAASLYIGFYRSQRQGETMHSPLNCLPGAGWEPVSQTLLRLRVASSATHEAPTEIDVNRYVVEKGLDRQLVLYWYQSHGRVVASEYWSKFYLIEDAVRLHRTDGALVRVISPISPADQGEAQAERAAVGFVKAIFPRLSEYLPS